MAAATASSTHEGDLPRAGSAIDTGGPTQKCPCSPAPVRLTMESELQNKEMTLGLLLSEQLQHPGLARLTAECRAMRTECEKAAVTSRPEHGAHVYYRGAFGVQQLTHHGIYCGRSPGFPEGSVIQYSAGATKVNIREGVARNWRKMEEAVVVRTPWERWTKQGKRKWDVVRTKPGEAKRPRELVVYEAQRRLGEQKYHILNNNCEHFATECSTGRATSKNSQNTVMAAAGVSVAAVAATVGLTAAIASAGVITAAETASRKKVPVPDGLDSQRDGL